MKQLEEILKRDHPSLAAFRQQLAVVADAQSNLDALTAFVADVKAKSQESAARFYETGSLRDFEAWCKARSRERVADECNLEFYRTAGQGYTSRFTTTVEAVLSLMGALEFVHECLVQERNRAVDAERQQLTDLGLDLPAKTHAEIQLDPLIDKFAAAIAECSSWLADPSSNTAQPWARWASLLK